MLRRGRLGQQLMKLATLQLLGSREFNLPTHIISAQLLSSSTHPLKSRDFIGHHGGKGVRAIEFSDDGTFFVSSGDDNQVLLWPMEKAIDEKWTPTPTAMDTKCTIVNCLAVSSDNGRIFSGSFDGKLPIHDINT